MREVAAVGRCDIAAVPGSSGGTVGGCDVAAAWALGKARVVVGGLERHRVTWQRCEASGWAGGLKGGLGCLEAVFRWSVARKTGGGCDDAPRGSPPAGVCPDCLPIHSFGIRPSVAASDAMQGVSGVDLALLLSGLRQGTQRRRYGGGGGSSSGGTTSATSSNNGRAGDFRATATAGFGNQPQPQPQVRLFAVAVRSFSGLFRLVQPDLESLDMTMFLIHIGMHINLVVKFGVSQGAKNNIFMKGILNK
ncbi:hypothetical protein FPV67DRAFT_1454478 [Lyophyllum atratum]|nr:hypothetical protein FPV67DRAFT_1454478 [Lyophyllum atratum]